MDACACVDCENTATTVVRLEYAGCRKRYCDDCFRRMDAVFGDGLSEVGRAGAVRKATPRRSAPRSR
jgi:hypothetical protein